MTNEVLMQQMFEIAQGDLATAKAAVELMRPKQFAISCFHCQQCAEKALKGYLHYKEIDPPRIHNLTELSQLCSDQDASFASLISICASLTPFGVASRYPSDQDIDEITTTTNIGRAQQIYDFCKAKVSAEA
jgi:HEPN domain-containing protein